jgi:heptosyltransferase III
LYPRSCEEELTVSTNNILFITLSNIGDVILTLPTLEAIHVKYPRAMIDIVGDKKSLILFKNCPYVNKIIEKNKDSGIKGLVKLILTLRQTRYDLAIDLRTDGLLYFIRSKIKLHKYSNKSTKDLHAVEKHFLVIKDIVDKAISKPKIWLSRDEKKISSRVLGKNVDRKILALGLGANYEGKIWPVDSFLKLAGRLKPYFDIVMLIGNKQDNKLAIEFQSMYEGDTINCSGQHNLLETASLLSKALFFVGNDSGLGHIASAVNIKSLTIFGPGEPWRYRPWGDKGIWIQSSDLKINSVNPDQAADEIISFLK